MIASIFSRFSAAGRLRPGVRRKASCAQDPRETFAGALVGCAAGDGAGYRLQMGVSPRKVLPGDWTDDSSLAFVSAECLIEKGAVDPETMARLVQSWYRKGLWSSRGASFDAGYTTRRAVEAYEVSGNPLSGPPSHSAAGNGSLTRVGPVALFFRNAPTRASSEAALCSRVTHGAPASVDACRLFAHVLSRVASGSGKDAALADGARAFLAEGPCHGDVAEVAAAVSRGRSSSPPCRGSGYAPDSLRMALWAFAGCGDLRQTVQAAVRKAEDADSVGALAGLLAGACYGIGAVPGEWLPHIPMLGDILSLSGRLYAASCEVFPP